MKNTIQARLDPETQKSLETAMRRNGWTTSEVVREGIRLVDKHHPATPLRKMIGIGMFDSGIPDLATNKKYMEDFGKKSMGRVLRGPAAVRKPIPRKSGQGSPE